MRDFPERNNTQSINHPTKQQRMLVSLEQPSALHERELSHRLLAYLLIESLSKQLSNKLWNIQLDSPFPQAARFRMHKEFQVSN